MARERLGVFTIREVAVALGLDPGKVVTFGYEPPSLTGEHGERVVALGMDLPEPPRKVTKARCLDCKPEHEFEEPGEGPAEWSCPKCGGTNIEVDDGS